uniref:Sushi domain-containing protein n=1 Tax=Chrysemys picta bellii TaxID=8478 RepID=A0A8C3P8F0_CHRPI
ELHTGVIMDDFSYGVSFSEVRCPAPQIQNGRRVSGDRRVYSYKDSVTFECDPGYTMKGHSLSQCQTDDTWDPPLPVCEPGFPFVCSVLCIAPEIQNGRKHNAKPLAAFPSGTYVNYSCEPGYALRGEATIYCTTSGTWKGCGVPTRLSFAELKSEYKNQSSFPVGKTINYTCRPGYSRYPRMQSTITCLENRKWSEAFEFCKSILCLPPPDIPNGRHTGVIMDGFSYGSSVTYKCDSGYPLTGEASIHCTTKDGLNGEWSARFVMLSLSATCMIPEVENGRTNGVQPAYGPRDIVVFECDHGFTLRGSPETQCQDDGRWDPPVPVCERSKLLQCPSPPAIANGKPSIRALAVFTTGTSVNYSCEPGYSLTGQASIDCTASGTWSPPPPRCEGLLKFFIRSSSWSCFSTSIDSKIHSSCVSPGIPCLPPPDIPNGKRTGKFVKNFSYGSAVTYKCDSGFPLIGEASIHCTTEDGLNGVWSAHPPRCGGRVCIVSGDRHVYSYKDSVTFECDPGYTMKGHSLSQCQTDDTWDPPLCLGGCDRMEVGNFTPDVHLPHCCCIGHDSTKAYGSFPFWRSACIMLQCPSPPAIANGKPSVQASAVFTTGTSVNYSCEPGYSLTGQASIYCMASGTWSPFPPQCEEVLCIAPEIEHGRKVDGRGPVYRPRDIVRFECDPGYTLNGSRQIQCQDEGTWDPPVPVCIQGKLELSPNYSLFGEASLHCTASGSKGFVMLSLSVTCVSPEVENGRTNGVQPAYRPRDIVVFECDPGYTLSGSPETQCQDDGRWDPPLSHSSRSLHRPLEFCVELPMPDGAKTLSRMVLGTCRQLPHPLCESNGRQSFHGFFLGSRPLDLLSPLPAWMIRTPGRQWAERVGRWSPRPAAG